MIKTLLLSISAVMPMICIAADIKGVITDTAGNPLEYSSVRISCTVDSVLVGSTVADHNGEYQIGNMRTGTYRITTLCLGYESADTCVNLTEPVTVINFRLHTADNKLEEVVVSADRFIRGKNGVLVIPGNEQIKHSSSGYELIRNLMIPGVAVNTVTNKVLALGGAVTIFVDGLPADERELKQLRPADVQSVQYMDAPTGKYAGNNVVINFIMRKHDSGGYVSVDGMQRIGYGNGDYNISSKLYKDNTQFTLFAGADYRNTDGSQSQQREEIFFPDRTIERIHMTEDSRRSENSQYVQARLRNKNDRRTLRATLSFVRHMTPDDFVSDKLSYHGLNDDMAIISSKLSGSRNFKYSLGLSGSFSLPENQFMEVSASATMIRNNYAYDYRESDTDILTSTAEDFYNMHADITYGINFSHGNHLVFKASEFYNVSSAQYFGNNESWQHLWSSETILFGEYMHPLWGKSSIRVTPGLSAQFYRIHERKLMKYFGPRMQFIFTCQPSKKQYIQLLALYGNSFPQLSFVSGATQQIDMMLTKRGNPDLKQSGISRFMALYGIGISNLNFQITGIYNGATRLPVVTYFFENEHLVQSYLPNGRWHQVDASLSATWITAKSFNIQIAAGWLFNGYYNDADIHRSCWKSSAQASYYIGDFALTGNVETPTKIVGYNLTETRTPWLYGFSVSWNRSSLRIEAGAHNLFSRRPVYRQVLNTPQYVSENECVNCTDKSSAYVKVLWSVDFGKKISHDKRNIDRTISTGVIMPDR